MLNVERRSASFGQTVYSPQKQNRSNKEDQHQQSNSTELPILSLSSGLSTQLSENANKSFQRTLRVRAMARLNSIVNSVKQLIPANAMFAGASVQHRTAIHAAPITVAIVVVVTLYI